MLARIVLVTICLALCSMGTADADSARKRAGKHARKGKVYEKRGQHLKAIAEFQAAYKLVPHPAMFYNIALNYRAAGDVGKAIANFERYIAIRRRGRLATRARRALKKLRVQWAEGEPQRRRRAAEQERVRREEQERKRKAAEESRKRAAEAEKLRRRNEAERKRAERRRNKRRVVATSPPNKGSALKMSGLITAGVGVIGLAVGIKFGLDASSISDELSRDVTGPWTQAELDREAEGESAQTKQILFTSIGAAALIAGGVMYMLGRSGGAKRSDRLSVVPVVAPDQMGWAMVGSF